MWRSVTFTTTTLTGFSVALCSPLPSRFETMSTSARLTFDATASPMMPPFVFQCASSSALIIIAVL